MSQNADPGFSTQDQNGNTVSYHTGEGSHWDGPPADGFHTGPIGDGSYHNTAWTNGSHYSFDTDKDGNTSREHTTDHSDHSITNGKR